MLFKLYCRIYQFVLKHSSKLLPWRQPVIIDKVAPILKSHNTLSVLLVTDYNIYNLGLTKPLEKELDTSNINYTIYQRTVQNPSIENVEEALALYNKNDCTAIIAIGGGSPIDCAKAVGARITHPKKQIIKMAGVFKVRKKLPLLIAIPTTAGTGSETTLAAVITDSTSHRKFAINDLSLIPHYTVLDPELTVSLPKSITAQTGMDALTHAIEAYIGRSNTKQTIKDAETAFRLIKDNLFLAYENGNDIAARKDMLLASYYAGRAFTRAYVGNVHAIAHTLSGFYQVPHGFANAVLLPVVLEYYLAKRKKAISKKLGNIAKIIGAGDDAGSLVIYIQRLNAKMNIPKTIQGIKDEDLPEMIKNAMKEANPLYPVPEIFSKTDFRNILMAVKE